MTESTRYRAVVSFRNAGKEYGRETYEVTAETQESARVIALRMSEDSLYDDARIPDKVRRVVGCRRILS